jgi:hypothetical protein
MSLPDFGPDLGRMLPPETLAPPAGPPSTCGTCRHRVGDVCSLYDTDPEARRWRATWGDGRRAHPEAPPCPRFEAGEAQPQCPAACYDRATGTGDQCIRVAGHDGDHNSGCLVWSDPPPADPVERPAHYAEAPIEAIDAIRAALGDEGFVAYCRGNAVKYLWRAGKKDATGQDLRKAGWYCAMAAHVLGDGPDPRGGK